MWLKINSQAVLRLRGGGSAPIEDGDSDQDKTNLVSV
jgi:hypothetical protein